MRGQQTYRFVVRGDRADRIGEDIVSASIHTERDQTVITGWVVDQSHLQRILDSISDLGLELVTLEHVEPTAPPPAG